MITLQVNTAGAWKTVARFDASRRADMIKAVDTLGGILGAGTKWCLLFESGKREWLKPPQTPIVARCRQCGCTDADACDDGCWWVEQDLCSSCAPAKAAAQRQGAGR